MTDLTDIKHKIPQSVYNDLVEVGSEIRDCAGLDPHIPTHIEFDISVDYPGRRILVNIEVRACDFSNGILRFLPTGNPGGTA